MTGDHGTAYNRANPELYSLSDLCPLINSGAQAGKARQRSTMGKNFWEIYPCEKF